MSSLLSDLVQKPYLGLQPYASGLAYTRPDPVLQLEATDATASGIDYPQINLKGNYAAVGSGGKISWNAINGLPAFVVPCFIKGSLNTLTSGVESGTLALSVIAAGTQQSIGLRGDLLALTPTVAGKFSIGTAALGWSAIYSGDGTVQAIFKGLTAGSTCGTVSNHPFSLIANNAVVLALTAAGDCTIGPAGTQIKYTVSTVALSPVTAGQINLGTAALPWKEAFVGDGTAAGIFLAATAQSKLGMTSNHSLQLLTNNVAAVTLNANGDVQLGPTGAATGMTAGFAYIPSAAGVPSGTPTSRSGYVPLYYDSTNNFLYVYNGGWKKSTVYA